MFDLNSTGDFDDLEKFLKKKRQSRLDILGQRLVSALRGATPKKSGKTADSWDYKITKTSRGEDLEIINTNVNDHVNIAVLIHYGHGTGTGGYVPPQPYIEKTIDDVYKNTIDKILKEYVE